MRTREETLEQLRAQIRGLEQGPVERRISSYVATPYEQLNGYLPGAGLPAGSIIEVLSDDLGIGTLSVALALARPALERKAAWALVDTDNSFYPLAAAQRGFDISRLIVIRPPEREAAWAFNQLLRCPEIGASFLMTRSLDNMGYRRLQLAAERGGGLGFVLRPTSALRKPCWAELRLRVEPEQGVYPLRRLRITLIHVRSTHADASVVVEL